MNMIRCPACRGSKKVAKLGGMMGNCNCCTGKGEVREDSKPNMVMAPVPEPVAEIVKAVSEAYAVSPEPVTQELPLRAPQEVIRKRVAEITRPEGEVAGSKPNIYKRKGG